MLKPTHINEDTGSVFCIYLDQLWRKLPERGWNPTKMGVKLINKYKIIDYPSTTKVVDKEEILLEALRSLAWYPKYKNTDHSQTIQEMCDIAFNALVEYGNEDGL